jgi:hypothetical protein
MPSQTKGVIGPMEYRARSRGEAGSSALGDGYGSKNIIQRYQTSACNAYASDAIRPSPISFTGMGCKPSFSNSARSLSASGFGVVSNRSP